MNNVFIHTIPFKILAVIQTHIYDLDFDIVITEIISVVKKFITYTFQFIAWSVTFKVLLLYLSEIDSNRYSPME